MEIADYIMSITKDDDKIWTTEADITFSYIWDFFGYSGGLITLNEIR